VEAARRRAATRGLGAAPRRAAAMLRAHLMRSDRKPLAGRHVQPYPYLS
jgi:hypothetical protein